MTERWMDSVAAHYGDSFGFWGLLVCAASFGCDVLRTLFFLLFVSSLCFSSFFRFPFLFYFFHAMEFLTVVCLLE